jgi:Tol biopolymer transport system component
MSGGSGGGAIGFARTWLAVAVLVLASLIVLTPLVAHAAVGDLGLVTRGADGVTPANGGSGPGAAVSGNGRFVAFESSASNLSDGAQAGVKNIYLYDRRSDTTTVISRADGVDGVGADGDSTSPAISPAGRFVAFASAADNLSADDDNGVQNVFLRDTHLNTTILISRATDGTAAQGGDSGHPAVASNGFVTFDSTADNLSPDDDDSYSNVYVRDIVENTLRVVSRISFASVNIPADGDSYGPTIDEEGRRIAYTSTADNLFGRDNNAVSNVFVTDIRTNFTTAASLTSGGFLASGPSDGDSYGAKISGNGRYVAFHSLADNFVDESIQTPAIVDVFRRDIQAGETLLVSRATGADGAPAFADSSDPAITYDGRYVAYASSAGNLSTEDTADADVFVRGMEENATELMSRAGGATGAAADGPSYAPAFSRDGRFLVFSSDAANLTDGDDDQTPVRDLFMRHLSVAPPPVDPGPDLGSNDHGHGGGHDGGAAHGAGHGAGAHDDGHGAHATATGAPDQSLVGPPVQDVDNLFVLVQPHSDAKVVVTASAKLPVRAARTRTFSAKPFTRKIVAHKIVRVRLRLTKAGKRAAKRALKRGKRVRLRVVSRAQGLPATTLKRAADQLLKPADGPWSTKRRTIRLIDP